MTSLTPLKKYRLKVIAAPLLKLLEVVFELTVPFLTKYVVDVGLRNSDWNFVFIMIALMLTFSIMGFFSTLLAQYLSSRVASSYCYDLRKILYHHLLSLSDRQLEGYGRKKALTILQNDAFSLQTGVNMFMRLIFRPPFLLLGSSILSFFLDWRAGLIVLGVVILTFLVFFLVILVSPKRYNAIQSDLDNISGQGADILRGARPIRAFDKVVFEEEKFSKKLKSYRQKNMELSLFNALVNPLSFFFVNLGIILVMYLSSFTDGVFGLTSGDIASLLSYLSYILAAQTMFGRLIVSLNKANASRKRIDDFLKINPEIKNNLNSISVIKAEPQEPLLKVEHLSFSYGGEKKALNDISFTLKRGETLGILGGTGSGKSTLLKLIARLIAEQEGTISYKGEKIKNFDLHAYRQDVAFLAQRSGLFSGTIRENLLSVAPSANDEKLIEALKAALAWPFVSQYEDGLDHQIVEGGANLSGGQKQRLLLARLFLRQSDLLLIDDATSALDYLSEQKIRQHLATLDSGKIFVSQRVSFLQDCTHILMLEHGEVLGYDTPKQLEKTLPAYRELVALQKSGRAIE